MDTIPATRFDATADTTRHPAARASATLLAALLAIGNTCVAAAEDARPVNFGIAAAETPAADSLAWNKPAQLAYFHASDGPAYYNVDVALQIKRTFPLDLCRSCFLTIGVAPVFQRSTAEKTPYDNKGVKLGLTFCPRAIAIDSRITAEFKASSNEAGKTDAAGVLSTTTSQQRTGKLDWLINNIEWLESGCTFATADLGVYSDHQSKSTAVSGNGRESGASAQFKLIWLPFGLPSLATPRALSVTAQGQRQFDSAASGTRNKDNYKYFMLEVAQGLDAYGDKGGDGQQWRPSIAVQRTGGQDLFSGLPRRFVTQLAFQIRYAGDK